MIVFIPSPRNLSLNPSLSWTVVVANIVLERLNPSLFPSPNLSLNRDAANTAPAKLNPSPFRSVSLSL